MEKLVIAAGRLEKRNGKVVNADVTAISWIAAAIPWGRKNSNA